MRLFALGVVSSPISSGLLEDVVLERNHLSGTIPTQWASLSLHTLSLARNRLSGTIPCEIGTMASLRELDLARTPLSGTIPTELGELPASLYALRLGLPRSAAYTSDDQRLSGTIRTQLGRLTGELRDLNRREARAISAARCPPRSATIGRGVGQMQQLLILGQPISGTLPSELARLTATETLYARATARSRARCPPP